MGIRGRTGRCDRLRTVWTPEMDRYFIDIMLEQALKGNKFNDHLFSKRAWKHMTSLFVVKFKFPYEKDVLKNRHKTLRNLYRAIKSLLDQRGFNWDETRQMVTADNNVWDEYIKVHPDARSFRIKTVPHYGDLCLIYGNEAIEEKSDNLPDESLLHSQPRNVNEETAEALHHIKVGEDYGVTTSERSFDVLQHAVTSVSEITTNSHSRTYWQPPMDRYFIDLMHEQVRKCSRIDGVFHKQAWMEMIASFNAKFGFDYEMDVLKNRHKTLKRQYKVIKNLLEVDGFIWDGTRQMVTAEDYVWQDYIKEHTDARQFMTRPVPYYKDLCMICDPSVDHGDCFSSEDVKQQNQVGAKFCAALTGFQSPSTPVSTEHEVGNAQESTHMCEKKRRLIESCSNQAHPKRSQGEDDGMASALREMASIVCSLSEKKINYENLHSGSIECVIEAVQALPEMDEDLLLDACDLLEDEKKAKTFMALDFKLRKKWLTRKLRPYIVGLAIV